jgi:hypothetical protein
MAPRQPALSRRNVDHASPPLTVISGSTGRSSIPETVVLERMAAAYWIARFRGR